MWVSLQPRCSPFGSPSPPHEHLVISTVEAAGVATAARRAAGIGAKAFAAPRSAKRQSSRAFMEPDLVAPWRRRIFLLREDNSRNRTEAAGQRSAPGRAVPSRLMLSSLPLQIVIFFDTVYAFLWTIAMLVLFAWKGTFATESCAPPATRAARCRPGPCEPGPAPGHPAHRSAQLDRFSVSCPQARGCRMRGRCGRCWGWRCRSCLCCSSSSCPASSWASAATSWSRCAPHAPRLRRLPSAHRPRPSQATPLLVFVVLTLVAALGNFYFVYLQIFVTRADLILNAVSLAFQGLGVLLAIPTLITFRRAPKAVG